MGRPSVSKTQKRQIPAHLRSELEKQIETGQCAYCRTPARPNQPLTREHVIPRARGGRRNDLRIIVPACARCNHHRGCSDLIPFLLARPQRISAFLDHLSRLTPATIRELDLRIFAELYTAVSILHECSKGDADWRSELNRLCSGRSLHRRRYAARRAVGALSERSSSLREQLHSPRVAQVAAAPRTDVLPMYLEEPLGMMAMRLLGLLALAWEVSAETVAQEMVKELSGSAMSAQAGSAGRARPDDMDGVASLDAWARRTRRKRLRVDQRRGRSAGARRTTAPARGRAA